jgi:small redox-active disulfide protein 2
MTKQIKILGTGCPKCKTLEEKVRKTVDEQQLDASISKVEDIMDIMAYGIMRTPGLVIDEKVVISSRLPSQSELNEFLK